MTIFVINIGDTGYSQYSIPLIQKLAAYNGIKIFILDRDISQNTNHVHPSWLKLFCHDIIDDDFIILWDLDLVPTKLYSLPELFNTTIFNMCYDTSYLINQPFNDKFKYNCGLIGVPKSYSSFLKEVYSLSKNSALPSFEQYHLNNILYDTKIPVNVLPQELNHMYVGSIDNTSLNMHYTYLIRDNDHRKELVALHYQLFKNNFFI